MKEQILNALEKIINARDIKKITEITVIIDGDDWVQITAEAYNKEGNKEELFVSHECDKSCEKDSNKPCEKDADILRKLFNNIFGSEDDELKIKFLDK